VACCGSKRWVAGGLDTRQRRAPFSLDGLSGLRSKVKPREDLSPRLTRSVPGVYRRYMRPEG
jgi:hypothetical protein